jgi:hypothetical protein
MGNNTYPKPPPTINIGDKVKFKNDLATLVIDAMVVVETRTMFCRNEFNSGWLNAYTVKFPNGETAEYDETQLVKLNYNGWASNNCKNCDDMVLYLDEECPDCGRQA